MYEEKSQSLADNQISQKIQLFISTRKLTNSSTFESVNSFVVVHLEEPGKTKKKILKTKTCHNDLNPNYAESIILEFIFQVRQKLTFQVFNEGQPPVLIGRLQTSVGEIFGSPTNGLIKPIKSIEGQETGKMVVRCEKIEKGRKKLFQAQLSAESLPNLTWWWFFGGTFPFFRIFRRRQKDELLIYESEVLKHTTNPSWKPFKISESKLCKNNDNLQVQIRVYSFSGQGNHTLIGSTSFTMNKLNQTKKFNIKTPQVQNSGVITFNSVKRQVQHQFGDFIQNGLQLALVTCIDFTASNGSPSSPTSLHYSKNYKKSQYEQAMDEVLNILMDYDYDKLVPCYGFGAQVSHPLFNTYGKVSHCFPLNANQNNADIYGKGNIMKAYQEIINHLKLSGPTKFEHLLTNAIQGCQEFQKNKVKTQYMILFIITDGQIHDKPEVIDLLVQCNKLPLSVIIVGVGKGTFDIMKELDDDDCEMVDSKGNKTERDLVQFVEFKEFKNNGVELARQVLYELPRQVQEYFQMMGIKPGDMKRRESDIEEQRKFKDYDF